MIPDKIKAPACRICNSKYVDQVNNKLANNSTLKNIVEFLKSKKIKISTTAVFNHKKKHLLPTYQDMGIKNKSKSVKYTHTKKKESEIEQKIIMSLTDTLDLIIEKGTEALKENKLKPNVNDINKAVEIKSKINEHSPFEQDIIKYFLGISLEHGILNK